MRRGEIGKRQEGRGEERRGGGRRGEEGRGELKGKQRGWRGYRQTSCASCTPSIQKFSGRTLKTGFIFLFITRVLLTLKAVASLRLRIKTNVFNSF